MHRGARVGFRVLTLGLGLALAAPAAEAIVIRHDRDDARYRALAANYPAAVPILPDGTGVLVAPDWVLTAAHVARGVSRRDPRVQVGDREIAVERVVLHPEWQRLAHDVALLKLREPVEGVAPVALYDRDDEVGQQVTFVGAGDFGTGLTGPQTMDRVRRGATNVVEQADADWIYFTFDKGESGTDLEGVSGPGDSGGPALVERDGRVYTLGVSVFADGDQGPGRYGVREGYTRVSTHRAWIEDVLSGKLADAGFAPGAAGGRAKSKSKGPRRGGPGGPGRAVSLAGLPDDAAGRLVRGWIDAYNTGDWVKMDAFIVRHATPAFLDRTPTADRRESYRALREERFGSIAPRGMVGRDEREIRVLVDSDRDQLAELHFGVTDGDAPRIDSLRIALVRLD